MRVIVVQYGQCEKDIRFVRDQVFVVEQQIPVEEEFDDRDLLCWHAVVYDDRNQPVATGRIDLEKGGKVGRVAVLRTHRRRGFGRAVMRALEDVARRHGCKRIWFHAQTAAVPFYESLGYCITSNEQFEEAGIPHVVMEKSLT